MTAIEQGEVESAGPEDALSGRCGATAASGVAGAAVELEAPADAKEFDGVTGKLEKFFSSEPGQGD